LFLGWLSKIIQIDKRFENFLEFFTMENNDIGAKIEVKRKEISVEKDFNRKAKLQKELQILELRKQIISFKERIEQIKNSF